MNDLESVKFPPLRRVRAVAQAAWAEVSSALLTRHSTQDVYPSAVYE